MTPRPLPERIAAVAALDDPVRRALHTHVTTSDSPVSRDAAAAALGLPRSTAAFHLDRLAAEGLVLVEYRRIGGRSGPGAGRPAKLYRRSDRDVAVSIPDRHYDLAGALLAAAVAESIRTGRSVQDVVPDTARSTGRRLATEVGSLFAVLERYGYQPRPDGNDGWILSNCPFQYLAQRFTALICGVNLELLRGVADANDDREHTMVLDPGPGRCCVHAVRASDVPGR